MFLAQVRGNVVATQKVGKVDGRKLLLVEPFVLEEKPKPQLKATGRALVAVDTVGAGDGEYVLLTQGSSARNTELTHDLPVDAVIIGIVDKVNLAGEVIYLK